MSDYSKKSWKDLRRCLENPVDTPDYVKAKEERDHRMKRYGLNVAVVGASVLLSEP
jgi:hypothetical protein